MKIAKRTAQAWAAAVMGSVLACACLSGCGKADKPVSADRPKSTGQAALEGVTGKTAVDQGQAMKKQLQSIDQQNRKDLQALEQ